MHALPLREGRGRRAKRARPVDGRAAADAASLQDADRLVLRLARGRLLVERGIGFRFAHAEIRSGRERALFDQNHRKPRLREDLGRRSAARAGADNHDIGLEVEIALERRRIDDAKVAHAIGGPRIVGARSADRLHVDLHADNCGGPG